MEHESKNPNGRSKGRGRGRAKKKTNDNEKTQGFASNSDLCAEPESVTLDLDADITQLEAPTFSTINKGPPEPMLRLNWDHKTHLIGEKVINPMIHCCDKCAAPILLYGRMIPCKHVFCFSCAEQESKICPRCQEKVVRIEKTGLGTVFMCTFGGTRYGSSGCRRTYLSQRDLQAHINHRHVSGTSQTKDLNMHGILMTKTSSSIIRPKLTTHQVAVAGDPRVQTNTSNDYFHKVVHSPSSHSSSSSTPQSYQNPRSQPHLSQSQHLHSPHILQHEPQQQHLHIQSVQLPMQHTAQLQSQTPRHLPVSTQQLMQTTEFVNQMIVPNYPPPTTLPSSMTPSPNVRSNLITVQIHDSNVDSSNTPVNTAMASNYSHQYSPKFSQNSPAAIPYPVPPPNQPTISQVPQSLPQYFASNPTTYTAPPPQRPTTAYGPNTTQQIIGQPPMIAVRGPPMVPPPRRPSFPSDMQPFPVPPPHRWHQPPPNQTHFY